MVKSVPSDREQFFLNRSVVKTITPTITASSAYSANDVVGDVNEITNAVRFAGRGGFIHSITIIDAAAQSDDMAILFFNADPATSTTVDHAGLTVTAADETKIIGHHTVESADWRILETGTHMATIKNIGLTFDTSAHSAVGVDPADGSTSIYMLVIAAGTPTYNATDALKFKIGIVQG